MNILKSMTISLGEMRLQQKKGSVSILPLWNLAKKPMHAYSDPENYRHYNSANYEENAAQNLLPIISKLKLPAANKFFLLAILLAVISNANAIAPTEQYSNTVKGSSQFFSLGESQFGERIDLSTGVTKFIVTDVDVKTNSGLPMSIGRKLDINSRRLKIQSADDYQGVHGGREPAKEVFGEYWELDIPYMRATYDLRTGWIASNYSQNRCSAGFIPPSVAGIWPHYYTYFSEKDYWSGISINIPEEGEENLLSIRAGTQLPNDGHTYYGVTKSLWMASCVQLRNGTGEGFRVVLPDGKTYYFDWKASMRTPSFVSRLTSTSSHPGGWFGGYDPSETETMTSSPSVMLAREDVYLFVTRVEDRFGNWIKYDYDVDNPWRLTAITSSDGAGIVVSYLNGKVSVISSGTRSWSYVYEQGAGSNTDDKRLKEVVLPDSSKWTYQIGRLGSVNWGNPDLWSNCILQIGNMTSDQSPTAADSAIVTMTHPSGVIGTFSFRKLLHGTNRTPGGCASSMPTVVPMAFELPSIYEKKISGPGLATMKWTFAYAAGWSWSASCPQESSCSKTSTTTVKLPNNSIERYKFGNDYPTNSGDLLEVQTEQNGQVKRTVRFQYLPSNAGQPFAEFVGTDPHLANNPIATKNRPLLIKTTSVSGVDFTSTVNTFDALARPTKTTKSNSLDYGRTEATAYHDNLSKWVIGQVATVTCLTAIPVSTSCNGNDQLQKTEYDANAMPWQTYTFGKLQQTLTYHPDGTLKTVSDGRDAADFDTTITFPLTLSNGQPNWKRGIPQQIQHPATPDHPVVYQKAGVNNNGEIDWVTDENNYKTCYTYDDMGRLASITYPDEVNIGQCDVDQSHWKKTTLTFRNNVNGVAYAAARGLPAGHWRQYIDTGGNRKVILFDAMWRPVVEQTYDNTSPTTLNATLSEVAKRYDSSGRLAFQSYPVRLLDSFTNPALKGVKTEYDALDRVTAVRQDAEGGTVLSTTTVYTPDRLKTEVTNPNGKTSYTWFMAYDQPHYDWPIQTYHPESMVTEIARDALGKPLTLTRRDLADTISSTRQYLYNIAHELCKTIEPETGSTVLHYDAAGNLDWSAAGLALPSTTSCDDTHASVAARKVSRSYDQRNRLKTLRFPDTRGNQDWFYTPDGLPSKVVTVNVPGAAHPENLYTYNKRRLPVTELQALPEWYTFSLSYGYDGYGHLKTLHYPSGLGIDFMPNALGQATEARRIADGHKYAYDASYHPNGAIAGFTYGNGVAYTMEQNDRQLPLRVDSAGVQKYEYWYDDNGNPTNIHDQTRGGNYSKLLHYDGLDRLTDAGSASFGGDHWHRFSYNALDNLTTWKHGGVKDHRYCYNSKNQLEFVRSGATTCSNGTAAEYFQYDVQGNVEIHDVAFDFDYGNRLREVIDVERYRYDAHGRRILAMNFASGTVFSQYGGSGQLLYQSNTRTGQNKEIDHIYLGGSLIAQRDSVAGNLYHHTDALGSPVAVTNQAGAVTERMVYEPYGKQMASTVTIGQDRPGYTGHVRDVATGLNYMQQRYYDPAIGRFLSVDPVTANSGTGANFNRYWYANNNPYKFTDPDGRDATWVQHKDGTITLVIKILATGSGASADVMSQIESSVEGISHPRSDVRIDVQFVEKNGPQVNRLDFSPGNGSCPDSGCVERLGGNDGHVDSSRSDVVDIATHEVPHFAGIDEAYVEGPRDANGNRTGQPKPGYDRTNTMADRRGRTLKSEQLEQARQNSSTKKVNER